MLNASFLWLTRRYLKDDLIETVNKRTSEGPIESSKFTWVITIPAIWDDRAKLFMRKAAEKVNLFLLL